MKLPQPSPRAYAEFVLTVLLTVAVLQYTGVAFGDPGTFDWAYLASLVLFLPVCTYLLTMLGENVPWIPAWDRMNRTESE